MPTVLVTGAAGRVASYVIPELLAHGYSVRGFDIKAVSFPDVESVTGDVRSFDDVLAAMGGIDRVCHLAAIAWDGLPIPELFHLNVMGTVHVFEAAERCGVARVVHASSIRAYGFLSAKNPARPAFLPVTEEHALRPSDGYGMSKAVTEMIARCYGARGLPVIVLRPGGVVDFADAARGSWGPLDTGVHAPDAAAAFRLALETDRHFGVYNVVSMCRYGRDGGVQSAAERHAELSSLGIGPEICDARFWMGRGNVYSTDSARCELGWEPTW